MTVKSLREKIRPNFLKDIVVFFGLGLLIFVVFWQTLDFGFFSDDYHMLWVTKHQDSVWKYFTSNLLGTREGHSYGPVYNVFLTVQYAVSGLRGVWFHVTSLLLHTIATFLVYKCADRLTQKRVLALGSAVLFAVLHAHASSVAWVAVQPHLIATVGYLGGAYFYLCFVQEEKVSQYILSLVFFCFGLWAKEVIMTLPAVFFLIEIFFGNREQEYAKRIKRVVLRLILPAGLLLLYVGLRHYATGVGAGFYTGTGLSFDVKNITQMFIELLANMFVNQPYRRLIASWFLSHIWVFILFSGIVLSTPFVFKFKHRPVFYFTVLTYMVASLPFLQVSYSALTNGGERYSYLVSSFFVIGFSIFLHTFFEKVSKYHAILFGIFMLIFSGYSLVLLRGELANWQVADSIVKHVVDTTPDAYVNNPDTHLLFAGLPDNIEGAELFRNGVLHMFLLEKNFSQIDAEIVPEYLMLTKENYDDALVTLESIESQDGQHWYLLNSVDKDARIFTGFPRFSRAFGTAILNRFDAPTQTGTSVRFEIDPVWLSELEEEGKGVAVLYYNGGGPERFSLSQPQEGSF